MMPSVSQGRCFVHPERDAAARCPQCARFFCRECVTEHDDRVICAACLAHVVGKRAPRRGTAVLLAASAFAMGFLVLWLSFYACGLVLLRIPSDFHKGTLFQDKPAEDSEEDSADEE
jgi:hypothetical protein